MSFLIGLFGKTAATEATVVGEKAIVSKSSGIFGSLFSGSSVSGIFSSLISASSTVMSKEYELYGAIAGGLFLVISNARKK